MVARNVRNDNREKNHWSLLYIAQYLAATKGIVVAAQFIGGNPATVVYMFMWKCVLLLKAYSNQEYYFQIVSPLTSREDNERVVPHASLLQRLCHILHALVEHGDHAIHHLAHLV